MTMLIAAEVTKEVLDRRLAYVDRVIESTAAERAKWRAKLGFQRATLDMVLDQERTLDFGEHGLDTHVFRALRRCEAAFQDMEWCVGEMASGAGYASDEHAVGLYRDRVVRCLSELSALIGSLSP